MQAAPTEPKTAHGQPALAASMNEPVAVAAATAVQPVAAPPECVTRADIPALLRATVLLRGAKTPTALIPGTTAAAPLGTRVASGRERSSRPNQTNREA